MGRLYFLVALAILFVLGLVMVLVIVKRLLIVVMPNELVILIGRRYRAPDGRIISYRVLSGGRAIRLPFLERVERIPRGPHGGHLDMKNLLTADGARLRLKGPVEIRVSLDPSTVGKAVERFMGRTAEEIGRVAMENLLGNIRLVLSAMDSERAVHDPMYFQQALMQESDSVFRKLGLEVVTLSATASIQDPPPGKGELANSPHQRLLDRLGDRELSAEAKQAALETMGEASFTLLLAVERTGPSSLGKLPHEYQNGSSAYGLLKSGLEVEVVYPGDRMAEVELMEGGGLEIPVLVRACRWDGPRQCLVVLAV